jgi:hypothetical protein
MGGHIWLKGFLAFEPRVAYSQLVNARLSTGTLVRPLWLKGNAGRATSLHHNLYPGIRLTTDEKSRKNHKILGNQSLPRTLMIGTELVLEMSVHFNTLTRVLARESFIELGRGKRIVPN